MLNDLCVAYGARAACFRWPADGPAVLLAETGPVARGSIRVAVAIPQQPAGSLWVDGAGSDDGLIQLAANALGLSQALKSFLGPVADQARIAQRLEDASRLAGRVAHDLDNVFQGVTGFLSLAAEELMPGSPAHDNVREADAAAAAGMKLSGHVHPLARDGRAKAPTPHGA